jgi:hypothetical protein
MLSVTDHNVSYCIFVPMAPVGGRESTLNPVETGPQIEQLQARKLPPAVGISVRDSEALSESQMDHEISTSLLSFVVLTALMWTISSAAPVIPLVL